MNRREAYYKRTLVVRRQKKALVVLFCLVLFASITAVSASTYAGDFKSKDSDSIKLYKSITIYSGDTLDSIAAEYMTEEYSSVYTYINEVSSINGITSETTLVPGNKLIVPYYMSKSISADPIIEISCAK